MSRKFRESRAYPRKLERARDRMSEPERRPRQREFLVACFGKQTNQISVWAGLYLVSPNAMGRVFRQQLYFQVYHSMQLLTLLQKHYYVTIHYYSTRPIFKFKKRTSPVCLILEKESLFYFSVGGARNVKPRP